MLINWLSLKRGKYQENYQENAWFTYFKIIIIWVVQRILLQHLCEYVSHSPSIQSMCADGLKLNKEPLVLESDLIRNM